MKQILLLAAIYSLIIHQSHKNAKEKEVDSKKLITPSISFKNDFLKKQITSPNFMFVKGGEANIPQKNIYAKWENKE